MRGGWDDDRLRRMLPGLGSGLGSVGATALEDWSNGSRGQISQIGEDGRLVGLRARCCPLAADLFSENNGIFMLQY